MLKYLFRTFDKGQFCACFVLYGFLETLYRHKLLHTLIFLNAHVHVLSLEHAQETEHIEEVTTDASLYMGASPPTEKNSAFMRHTYVKPKV